MLLPPPGMRSVDPVEPAGGVKCVGIVEPVSGSYDWKRAGVRRRGTAAIEAAVAGRVALAERARAVVVLRLQHRGDVAVRDVGRRVAVVVGGVHADDEREVLGEAGVHVVRRGLEARAVVRVVIGEHRPRQAIVVLVVVVHAVVGAELHAFKVVVELEVHDARDRVRAVHRRRAAGQDVDGLDELGRDLVDVRRAVAARVAGAEAPAVDQHQGALRTEVAQVDLRRAVRAVGKRRTLRREHLRQLVQHVLNARRTALLQVRRSDLRDGADRDLVRGERNARTRDDDLFDGRTGGRRSRLRVREASRGKRAARERQVHGPLQVTVSGIGH